MKGYNIKLTTLAVATTYALGAYAVPQNMMFSQSGSGDLIINGDLNRTNACEVSIDNNGLFDIGTVEIKNELSLDGGEFASKNFNARVSCDYPSAVIVKLSSSRGSADLPDDDTDFSQTRTSVTGSVAYTTRVELQGNITVTPIQGQNANDVKLAIKKNNVGLDLNNLPTALHQNFQIVGNGTGAYASSNENFGNAFTFLSGNSFSMHETYRVPFKVSLVSKPLSEWINEVQNGNLNVSEKITFQSYII